MRRPELILKWFALGMVALVVACIGCNAIGYLLFRTVFAGLGYDIALPLSVCVGFALPFVLVILAGHWLWKRTEQK